MASDYDAIRTDNERRYGTDVGRYGKSLLTDLYDDRTHFIYELLQNAEDALRRRNDEPQSRTVRFDLSEHALRVSHYGKLFDRRDVEGVCGIALSTMGGDLTRIGRFGIGFKSVYGFTDRPEIHSGDEDFGIDSFVWPSAQPAIERNPDQTVFIMPLRDPGEHRAEIANGLRRISLDTLLFLRQIETIEWSLPDGTSGRYVRGSETRDRDIDVRRVTVTGESTGQGNTERSWLVFSKPTYGTSDVLAGRLEVAFLMDDDRIVPVSRSPLVVFFPTVVETNLGFRIQGPYRTTPSRDNVPKTDEWNQECVKKTGDVLVDALVWLRDHNMLDVNVLHCLPIDQRKFDDDSMFAPLYNETKKAFHSHRLLPIFGSGYAASSEIKIARSGELRGLFTPDMLADIFQVHGPLSWLSDTITDRSAHELWRYLREDLGVDEVRSEHIIGRLDVQFLEQQGNDWVRRLYEFMNVQKDLYSRAKKWPLVRLSDGRHVVAYDENVVQAYLPGVETTNFPTVHRETCSTDGSRQFLEAIGLLPPDPVDDIILNVLPKYVNGTDIDGADYAKEIARIVDAFQTDSTARREELVAELSETQFLATVDAGNGELRWAAPSGTYIRTDRLASLFDGVEDVLFVDQGYDCLRGEKVRSVLEACGASRYLRREEVECRLSERELREIRRDAGLERKTRGRPSDFSLRGVDELLDHMAGLSPNERKARAATLWEALADVAGRTPGAFDGTYSWGYSHESKTATFDAAVVRRLNEVSWVPAGDGEFRVPAKVSFETLGWRSNPFLLSKIRFKATAIDLLAKEADIEPDVLYLLKEHGITNMAVALERLGLTGNDEDDGASDVNSVEDAVAALGIEAPTTPSVEYPDAIQDDAERDRGTGAHSGAHRENAEVQSGRRGARIGGGIRSGVNRGATVSGEAAPFISYVAVDREDGTDDPDGLVHEERMALEEAAITLILNREQDWQRTPTGYPGFDLFKVADGRPCSWCEVKAMRGCLHDRPVGLTHTQFKHAQERGNAYWLYVVEHAGDEDARIVRIRDPAGKAQTFTFDRGWLEVAEVD